MTIVAVLTEIWATIVFTECPCLWCGLTFARPQGNVVVFRLIWWRVIKPRVDATGTQAVHIPQKGDFIRNAAGTRFDVEQGNVQERGCTHWAKATAAIWFVTGKT